MVASELNSIVSSELPVLNVRCSPRSVDTIRLRRSRYMTIWIRQTAATGKNQGEVLFGLKYDTQLNEGIRRALRVAGSRVNDNDAWRLQAL